MCHIGLLTPHCGEIGGLGAARRADRGVECSLDLMELVKACLAVTVVYVAVTVVCVVVTVLYVAVTVLYVPYSAVNA